MGKYPWSEREEQRREQRRPVPKKKQPLSKVSDKRKEDDKVYFAMRDLFLKMHTECEIKAPGCTGAATVINHKAGRIGQKYLDQSLWQPSCRHCNVYIENNDSFGREGGHKQTKHQ